MTAFRWALLIAAGAWALLIVAVLSGGASAEPQADPVKQLEQWLWPPKVAPVPFPQARPVEAPQAAHEPTVVELPPVAMPQVESVPIAPPPAVERAPAPHHAAPVHEVRERVKARPKQTERAKPKLKPQAENGFCFFPISCSTVCSYARAGSNRRGTPCQNRLGLACIQSTCPDVLRKRRQ
jgi:hypothetical protein